MAMPYFMSAIGNKIKAGYFATPAKQGEYIRKLLSFESNTSIFDPTCGEGDILKQLAEACTDRPVTVQTYGVELDKGRAEMAKKQLDKVVQSAIEAMVISHGLFGMIYLNPPYDHTMLGTGDEKTERKEYIELVRNTKYLAPNGVMVYVIPSYRFADSKIARFLASHFEDIAITKFTDDDYEDYCQCIFIGRKRDCVNKSLNNKLFEFLQKMHDDEFIKHHVTPVDQLVTIGKQWSIPGGTLEIPTFYSRVENKSDFIEAIRNNKGFAAFMERTRPKQLVLGGNPIINVAQGQMALLLSSGAVNGLLGEGDTLHAVQGMEIVSQEITHEETETAQITKRRTKREVSIKTITPDGKVTKFV